MALSGNVSTSTEGSSSVKYVGICPMKVAAINPTMNELNEMGIKVDKEPSYVTKDEQFRILFILQGETPQGDKVRSNHSVFIKNEPARSKDGKIQLVDKHGASSYITEADYRAGKKPYDWFDYASAREGFKGEADLYDFLNNWLDAKRKDEMKLETNVNRLMMGEVNELRIARASFPDNLVKVLLGVRKVEKEDGSVKEYQDHYPYVTARAWSSDYTRFWKQLAARPESWQTKYDFGPIDLTTFRAEDFRLKPIHEAYAKPTPATAVGGSSTPSWMQQTPKPQTTSLSEMEEDDLPF